VSSAGQKGEQGRTGPRDRVRALFSPRRRRSLLRGYTLLASSGAPGISIIESLPQNGHATLHPANARIATPASRPCAHPKTLLAAHWLASCLAQTTSRMQATKRYERPVRRRRCGVSAWMVRAQSMPRIAGRTSCCGALVASEQSPTNRKSQLEWGFSCVWAAHILPVHVLPAHRPPVAPTSGLRVCCRDARWVCSVSQNLHPPEKHLYACAI
jgi:hypothetical protein